MKTKVSKVLATLTMVLVLALVSVVPAFADSGNTPFPVPTRTTKPIAPEMTPPPAAKGGGGYWPNVEFVTLNVNKQAAVVNEQITITVGIWPLEPSLTPAKITLTSDEFQTETTMYGPSIDVSVSWWTPGEKTVFVEIEAANGSKKTNSIRVRVEPGPLYFSFSYPWAICVKGWSCNVDILADRELVAKDFRNGPVLLKTSRWLYDEPWNSVGEWIQVNSKSTTFSFVYTDKVLGSRVLGMDLFNPKGEYLGMIVIFMIDLDRSEFYSASKSSK